MSNTYSRALIVLAFCFVLYQYCAVVNAAVVASPTVKPKGKKDNKKSNGKSNKPSVTAQVHKSEKSQTKSSTTTTTLPSAPNSATMKVTKTTTTTTTTVTETMTTGSKDKKASSSKKPMRKADPTLRRVYTTNALPEFQKDHPALFPAEYLLDTVNKNRTVLDVGANNGDGYTLTAARAGHTVLAFEPSVTLREPFKQIMLRNRVPLSLVHVPAFHDPSKPMVNSTMTSSLLETLFQRGQGQQQPSAGAIQNTHDTVRVIIPRDGGTPHPRVYLLPFALANQNGVTSFYEAGCKGKDITKCGKTNRFAEVGGLRGNTRVQMYRLDDLVLPVEESSVWFMKIDVEGYELDVIKGARQFLRKGHVKYIAVEFSPNGKKGLRWGTELLEELFQLGFSCYHLRGFGTCTDGKKKPATLGCNYPFSLSDYSKAPNFKQYAKVFEMNDKSKDKARMADLMCKRRDKKLNKK